LIKVWEEVQKDEAAGTDKGKRKAEDDGAKGSGKKAKVDD
jgi:hypothetical protein